MHFFLGQSLTFTANPFTAYPFTHGLQAARHSTHGATLINNDKFNTHGPAAISSRKRPRRCRAQGQVRSGDRIQRIRSATASPVSKLNWIEKSATRSAFTVPSTITADPDR